MSFFDAIKATKIHVQNYKSFGNDEQGFDRIEPINLIVGRNNSGKSALLDLVQFSCGGFDFSSAAHNRSGQLKFILEARLSEQNIAAVFRKDTSGGPYLHGNHFEFGKRFIGRRIRVGITQKGGQPALVDLDNEGLQPMPE